MNGVELEGFAGSVDEVEFDLTNVDPTFFDVLGVPLVSGRGFTALDVATGTRVAIINETMARRYWPDTNPIGKHIILDAAANRTWEIVGVVGGGNTACYGRRKRRRCSGRSNRVMPRRLH